MLDSGLVHYLPAVSKINLTWKVQILFCLLQEGHETGEHDSDTEYDEEVIWV